MADEGPYRIPRDAKNRALGVINKDAPIMMTAGELKDLNDKMVEKEDTITKLKRKLDTETSARKRLAKQLDEEKEFTAVAVEQNMEAARAGEMILHEQVGVANMGIRLFQAGDKGILGAMSDYCKEKGLAAQQAGGKFGGDWETELTAKASEGNFADGMKKLLAENQVSYASLGDVERRAVRVVLRKEGHSLSDIGFGTDTNVGASGGNGGGKPSADSGSHSD